MSILFLRFLSVFFVILWYYIIIISFVLIFLRLFEIVYVVLQTLLISRQIALRKTEKS